MGPDQYDEHYFTRLKDRPGSAGDAGLATSADTRGGAYGRSSGFALRPAGKLASEWNRRDPRFRKKPLVAGPMRPFARFPGRAAPAATFRRGD